MGRKHLVIMLASVRTGVVLWALLDGEVKRTVWESLRHGSWISINGRKGQIRKRRRRALQLEVHWQGASERTTEEICYVTSSVVKIPPPRS